MPVDLSMVEQARQGDASAFEAIYREYRSQIAGYLYRMVGDPDIAADLTQDVFMNAYRSIGRTQPGLNLRGWLYTIASNAALSYHRRRKIVRWSPLDPGGNDATALGPEEQVVNREELGAALRALPPEQAACILLSVRDGFSYQEIASMLGISEGAVKTRTYRARLALARSLRASEESDG